MDRSTPPRPELGETGSRPAARWLAVVPWEDWLVRPLVCVRRDLRIAPPERAHPGGILAANQPRAFRSSRISSQEV